MGAAITVHRTLGSGLLESAYEGAFEVELKYLRINVQRQVVFPLVYRGEYIGAYIADMVVENTIIIELKSVSKLNDIMAAQLLNYLKLSKLPVGYLFNFNNAVLEWRRFVNTREAAS
jgi:GxxExxY protein